MREKQECIPVGCIPPAAVAVQGGLPQWDTHPTTPSGVGLETPLGVDLEIPPLCGQTDMCKNITFANFICGR